VLFRSAEDWSETLMVLCAQCSAGLPHDHHPRAPELPWHVERKLGLALADERQLERLQRHGQWRRGVREVVRVL
jgi:hypothetical protein